MISKFDIEPFDGAVKFFPDKSENGYLFSFLIGRMN
jgi:hypothetical protein